MGVMILGADTLYINFCLFRQIPVASKGYVVLVYTWEWGRPAFVCGSCVAQCVVHWTSSHYIWLSLTPDRSWFFLFLSLLYVYCHHSLSIIYIYQIN